VEGEAKVSEEEEFEFRLRLEKEREAPGKLVSAAAGIGKGVGTVALNAQRYLGKGLSALPGDAARAAGGWLTKDAEGGLEKIAGELAPYKEANPISAGVGEVAGNVAATLPVGGGIASLLSKAPGASQLPNVIQAIQTSGFSGGNALTRAAGGAVTGGVSAGLVDPEHAGTGAVVGAALPGALQVAGKVGQAVGSKVSDKSRELAEWLMKSALKPTPTQHLNGEAATAVQTLLKYGISPNKAGVNKLRALIDAKNSEISNMIGSSAATVDRSAVAQTLGDVRARFANQVSPTKDLGAIQGVADDFAATAPKAIPVQQAQRMKQGTYRAVDGKYGELGSAETEAQKALARGLKEEIATAVPGVGALNAEESRLLATLGVAERRALMDMNKNPMGLAALASNPVSWAAFMADRSATFKALAARLANQAGKAPNALQGLAMPAVGYRAAPVLAADQ
jgi:hypothetical protein